MYSVYVKTSFHANQADEMNFRPSKTQFHHSNAQKCFFPVLQIFVLPFSDFWNLHCITYACWSLTICHFQLSCCHSLHECYCSPGFQCFSSLSDRSRHLGFVASAHLQVPGSSLSGVDFRAASVRIPLGAPRSLCVKMSLTVVCADLWLLRRVFLSPVLNLKMTVKREK